MAAAGALTDRDRGDGQRAVVQEAFGHFQREGCHDGRGVREDATGRSSSWWVLRGDCAVLPFLPADGVPVRGAAVAQVSGQSDGVP
ncbi:hypothetical protein ADL27_42155 [Streptomyces sp. NRRL F-6602]|nr:hypothetical protein ADL27_42155 [Streptomyces sp. NRRL F-6602]